MSEEKPVMVENRKLMWSTSCRAASWLPTDQLLRDDLQKRCISLRPITCYILIFSLHPFLFTLVFSLVCTVLRIGND